MIAYLHGFNSGHDPLNPKITALQKIDKDVLGFSYDTFASREDVIGYIVEVLKSYADDLVIVGTSLGAYYADACAKVLGVPSVLINPCVNPYETFSAKSLDTEYVNYVHKHSSRLTEDMIVSFKDHPLGKLENAYSPLILLADGDEVFNSDETAELLKHYEVVRFPGGSHRFEQIEESMQPIEKYINLCKFATNLNF
jgi:predicted esterase YcpF (UPF0227 family)